MEIIVKWKGKHSEYRLFFILLNLFKENEVSSLKMNKCKK